MRYLCVSFGDNDFGGIVVTALQRIWGWVHQNNARLVGAYCPRTIPQMFRSLHKSGALRSMILRMVDVEHLASDVEFATRGLYWKRVSWKKKVVAGPFEQLTEKYLAVRLSFHPDKRFTNKWQNGERAFLDLQTGEAATW